MHNPAQTSKAIKIALVGVWVFVLLLVVPGSFSKATESSKPKDNKTTTAKEKKEKKTTKKETAKPKPGDFVGSETCKTCHTDMFEHVAQTKHGKFLEEVISSVSKAQGCESCHGPGKAHVEGGGDKNFIIRLSEEPAKTVSETCLQCHAGKEEHNNYRRGEHWRNDISCIDCHSLHSADKPSAKMLTKTEPQLCLTCHSEMKADFAKAFHHKVPEGAIKCSDCHNPHGGFEQKQLRTASGADAACMKCHTEKQGPFVFEHIPSKVEGCTACHSPHGSNNSHMLKRSSVAQLCIECHSTIGTSGALDTPSFHNLAAVNYPNCTFCHTKMHGSNTSPVFFR